MNIKKEKLTAKLANELMPLFEEHFKEIAHDQSIILDPDWEKYFKLQEAGVLFPFIARDKSDEIIGYIVYMVHGNIHYKNSTQAVQDIFYVSPDRRGHMAGIRLLKYSEEELKKTGVQVIHQHVKLAHDFSPLLEKLGYEDVEKILIKRIG